MVSEKFIKERDRRVGLFDQLMEEKGLDGLVFTSTAQQTCQIAVKYAANYMLSTRRDYCWMARGGMPTLILPTSGQQFSAQQVSWLPAENILSGDMLEGVVAFIRSLGSRPKIGVYELEQLPANAYMAMEAAGAVMEDITYRLSELRAPQSDFELELTRSASALAVSSFEWVVQNCRPGKTERELIGGAEGFLRAHGAEDTLVLTRSQKPHTFITRPKNIPIREDGIFVYSAEVAGEGGYWTQLVRPIFMSRGCQSAAYDVLQVNKEALAAAEAILRPGARICDVDNIISETVKKHGCTTGVWSGHGMGADLGGGIDIGADNTMELRPNMILTLHPSVIGDGDGLLYGNTYRVTETGAENLTGAYTGSCYLEDLIEQVGRA